MRAAAKAREDARKKMLADRRAAMKQKPKQEDVEIFVSWNKNKTNDRQKTAKLLNILKQVLVP